MKKTIICSLTGMLLILGALQFPINGEINEKNINITTYDENINENIRKGFLDVTFIAGDYTFVPCSDGSTEIQMSDYGNLLVPGHPLLPTKTFFIGLPPGCIAESIELLTKETVEQSGTYRIRQAPSICSNDNTPTQNSIDDTISHQVETYPSAIYEYLGMSQLRKYSLAMIRFYPMTFYPTSGRLFLHDHITIRVHYTAVEKLSEVLLSDTAMEDIAEQVIYNYDSIAKYYQKIETSRQTYDYVIITTSSLSSSLTGFFTWKTTIGYLVNIVTLTWILTNYPASDTQKSIRDFLVANYASWGIKYVLIVGTHASIPMRTCYPDPTNHNNDGTHNIPTDYYYADLSGNWDSDGDGFYGERGQDAVDFTPEVFVGRIPNDSASTVSSITFKIQQFEQNAYTGWKKNAMLLGAIYNYANEDNTGNPRLDGSEVMEKCKTNLLSGFTITTMYEKQGYSQSPYTCTYPLNNANIITQWSGTTGWGIVNWGAHGLQTSASRKVWNTDDGDGIPENNGEIIWPIMIQNTDPSGFNNNKAPIVFAASCYVSHPETVNNLGASLLTNGAAAFVGATRVSYASSYWTQPSHGGHGTICYDFTDRIANKNEDCGQALYNAKQYVYNTYPWNLWQDNANMYDFNLYGDPAMGMNLAPGRPGQPTGPTTGITGTSYSYSAVASDPTTDKLRYGWDWNGDGTVDQWDNNNGNYYTSGVPVSISHVFTAPGTFNIQVKVEDIYGRQGVFSPQLTVVITQNLPPTKPLKPSGPTTGSPGTSYTYSTSTSDPESNTIAYGWDWDGDGTVDQWDDNTGNYYPSGQTISTSHTWTNKGTYNIKVKPKDIYGNEGPWSDPLSVTMPLSYKTPLMNLWKQLCQCLFEQSFPLLRYLLGFN